MRKYIITANDAGQRADKFVAKAAPNIPRSMLFKSFRNRRIKRNGKNCHYAEILQEGDVMELLLYDEFFEKPDYSFTKVSSEVTVVYEDENILLLDKPSGQLIHGSKSELEDTLQERALHYLYKNKAYLPEEEHSFAPAFVNRLDRNTRGLVIMAKNFPTLQLLSEKMKCREIKRYYLCQVQHTPSPKKGVLLGYHTKDRNRNVATISPEPSKGSRKVETHYQVLYTENSTSWMEVELITGRSHQIRAQLSHFGYPLIGDRKYGYQGSVSGGQRLYSYKVTFDFANFAGKSEHLEYLTGKSFTIQNIPGFSR